MVGGDRRSPPRHRAKGGGGGGKGKHSGGCSAVLGSGGFGGNGGSLDKEISVSGGCAVKDSNKIIASGSGSSLGIAGKGNGKAAGQGSVGLSSNIPTDSKSTLDATMEVGDSTKDAKCTAELLMEFGFGRRTISAFNSASNPNSTDSVMDGDVVHGNTVLDLKQSLSTAEAPAPKCQASSVELRQYARSPIKAHARTSWADLTDREEERHKQSQTTVKFPDCSGMDVDNGVSKNITAQDSSLDGTQGVCKNAPMQDSTLPACDNGKVFGKQTSTGPSSTHPSVDTTIKHSNTTANEPRNGRPGFHPTNAWNKLKHISINMADLGVISHDGKKVAIDDNAVDHNISKLRKALVGRLIGKKLPFSILDSELHRRWECFGEFDTVLIEADCFICVFHNTDARDAVLMGGPWQIAGHILGLDKWTPEFSARSMAGLSSPVWIRFPHLPLMYWDNKTIARMAAMIGEPLWLDAHTGEWGRSEYARVCIRLALDKKLPTGVWVEGRGGDFFQKVEFEGISLLCFNCGFVGHRDTDCQSPSSSNSKGNNVPMETDNVLHASGQVHKKQHESHNVPMKTNSIPCTNLASNLASCSKAQVDNCMESQHLSSDLSKSFDTPDDPNAYGPWILVSRRKRPPPSRSKSGKQKQPLWDRTSQRSVGVRDAGNVPRQRSRGFTLDELTGNANSPLTEGPRSSRRNVFSFNSAHNGNSDALASHEPGPSQGGSKPNKSTHRSGTPRVSKAHFDKELMGLGPIESIPRKRKKRAMDSLRDEPDAEHTTQPALLLLTNSDGGDASPSDANV